MGLYGIKRAAVGVAFVLAAWQLNAHNLNYDPTNLTLETMVGIVRSAEKGEESNSTSYMLNYAIMAFGAYWVARGVSQIRR